MTRLTFLSCPRLLGRFDGYTRSKKQAVETAYVATHVVLTKLTVFSGIPRRLQDRVRDGRHGTRRVIVVAASSSSLVTLCEGDGAGNLARDLEPSCGLMDVSPSVLEGQPDRRKGAPSLAASYGVESNAACLREGVAAQRVLTKITLPE